MAVRAPRRLRQGPSMQCRRPRLASALPGQAPRPARAAPFACGVCHVVPTGILSPGHIDDPTPVARVTFGGLAAEVPAGPASTGCDRVRVARGGPAAARE